MIRKRTKPFSAHGHVWTGRSIIQKIARHGLKTYIFICIENFHNQLEPQKKKSNGSCRSHTCLGGPWFSCIFGTSAGRPLQSQQKPQYFQKAIVAGLVMCQAVKARSYQYIYIYQLNLCFLPQNTFFILFPPPAHVKDHDHGRYAEVSHEGAKCNALLEMEAPSCCPRCCVWCCTKSGSTKSWKEHDKTSICPCLLLKWTVSDRAAGDDDDDKLKVVVRKNVLKTVCRVGLWSVVTAAGAYLFYPSLQQFLCLAEHVGKQ